MLDEFISQIKLAREWAGIEPDTKVDMYFQVKYDPDNLTAKFEEILYNDSAIARVIQETSVVNLIHESTEMGWWRVYVADLDGLRVAFKFVKEKDRVPPVYKFIKSSY